MKTTLELNPEKKAAMIRLLAEAIHANTRDEHEVYELIHALKDGFGFLSDQRWRLGSNTPAITRYIEEELKKSAWLKSFQEMSEIAFEAMIVTNQSWEGIKVICSMDEELKAISETYGG